jgi:hypothetical protein
MIASPGKPNAMRATRPMPTTIWATRFVRTALFATTLVAAFPIASARAGEAPKGAAGSEQEARSHFLRGVDFSHDSDFRSAIVEFRRAYDLAPNYHVLYNIAQTALELQDYTQALSAFEKYLADGGAEVPAARRAQVEADIKRLEEKIARVSVEVNLPNAEVFVDDIQVGTSPLAAPLRVNVGRHKFSASTSTIPAVVRVIDVAAGENPHVALELRAPEAAPVALAPPVTKPSEEHATPPRTALWVGVGVTGALAVGTAVVGVLALSAKSSFDSELGRYPGNASQISSTRSTLKSTAVVFDVVAAGTIVAGIVTGVIGLTGARHGDASAAGPRANGAF